MTLLPFNFATLESSTILVESGLDQGPRTSVISPGKIRTFLVTDFDLKPKINKLMATPECKILYGLKLLNFRVRFSKLTIVDLRGQCFHKFRS